MNDDTYFLFTRPGPVLRPLSHEDRNIISDYDGMDFTRNAMTGAHTVAQEVATRINLCLHLDVSGHSSVAY